MATPSTRERIRVLRNSLKELRLEEMPPWDMGRIYCELLDVVAAEHPDQPLVRDAERPIKNSDRRSSVQVAAMLSVLDQLLLIYPRRVSAPAVSRRPSVFDQQW